jgi:putative peptide zinc metalloprotease protein
MQAAPTPQRTWRRVPGVTLLGPVTGSGLSHPTALVRRGDGQVVQLSELLALVLATAETATPTPDLARAVSDEYGRELTADGLTHLIDTKLAPLGLIEDAAEAPRAEPLPTSDPLLALRLRGTILPAAAVVRVSGWLAPLFRTPVVIVVLIAFVAVDVALLFTADLLAAFQQSLETPVILLGLFGLLTLGALIHELGHAAACAFGGGRPGVIGFGVYLVFPAFFTDVTDSYRLGRAARLRTDLGGLYFNVLCVIAAGAGHLASGQGLLLLVVVVMQLQMLQQLPPAVRLDGYFILADLAGVPDLFARVRPVFRSLVPGRAPDPRVAELRPAARRIVTAWVLIVIPLLVAALLWTLWMLPAILTRTAAAISMHAADAAAAWGAGRPADLALAVLGIILLALPIAGLGILLARVAGTLARWATRTISRSASKRGRTDHVERTGTMSTITRLSPDDGRAPSRPADAPSLSDSDHPTDLATARRPDADAPQPSTGPSTGPAASTATSATATGAPRANPASSAPRRSFLVEERLALPATQGLRGAVARATGLRVPPSAAEAERRRRLELVSTQWPRARTISIVNGKGGVGKTVTTAMLAAVFARNGGTGVLAWDNNDTRGTLGWRTERSTHDATIQDLIPRTDELLGQRAQVAEIAQFVHHQATDKYDVLRSNPALLATNQRITREQFDALHEVATKYFRMVLFDSGNDESAPRWLRMIDVTDQLVVATTTQGESAESGALLLEALIQRDAASAELARNAVVVVLRAEQDGSASDAKRIAQGYAQMVRAVVTVPFDRALHGGALRFDSLEAATQDAWLRAAAEVAEGL